MAKQRKTLTAKEVESIHKPGKYAVGNGVFLKVGKTPNRKSWIKRYRFLGRHDLGLGSYPEVSLAEARAAGGEADRLIARRIDPLTQREQQDRTQWLAAHNTFGAIAQDMIHSRSTLGDEPWRPATAQDAKYMIPKYLAPILNRPIDQITAVDLFDLVLKPLIEKKAYRTMEKTRVYASQIFKWAYGRQALKVEHANPASMDGPLAVLLQGISRRGNNLPSLDWDRVPTLIAALQTHIHGKVLNLNEISLLWRKSRTSIRDDIIRGRLKGDRVATGSRYWTAEMKDCVDYYGPPVAEIPPTTKTLCCYLITVSTLLALRPSEARFTNWTEYDPVEKRLTIPWQRTKEGRQIRRDLILPLHPAVLKIFDSLRTHQHREGIFKPDQFIFAQFPVRGYKRAKPLFPPSRDSVMVTLRQFLSEEDADKTWHGMRDAFGSWSDERGFREKDKERVLGHIKGFGEDDVSRRYNRQSKRIIAITQLLNAWAEFCLGGGGEPGKVRHIEDYRKQA
jgi:integrase